MLRINCTFTENFKPLFHDQKIYDLYDVKFDFKIESGVSSNTSIINADKYKGKNVDKEAQKVKPEELDLETMTPPSQKKMATGGLALRGYGRAYMKGKK